MRLSFSVLLLLISATVWCQQIVDTSKYWSVAQIHCQPWGNAYSTQHFRFDGDTIIDNISYQMVMISEEDVPEIWDFFGTFIREDSGKVYLKELFKEEGLIYDFSIRLGDTLLVNNTRAAEPVHLILESIDTIDNVADPVERWQLKCLEYPDNTEIWYRGIGSSAGVLNSTMEIFGGLCGLYSLLCCNDEDGLLFRNQEYNSCYLLTTGEANMPSERPLKIHYNYASSQLKVVRAMDEPAEIEIYTSGGRLIVSEKLDSGIEYITLPGGTRGLIIIHVVSGSKIWTSKYWITN